MLKAINQEFPEMRVRDALHDVRTFYTKRSAYGGTRSYRFAVARKFTLCYVAFLQYLVGRLNIHQPETLGMQDIIHRCRRYMLFGQDDERMMIKMSMLYASLSYFGEGFDGTSDEPLQEIPHMCDFVEQFIGFNTTLSIMPVRIERVV